MISHKHTHHPSVIQGSSELEDHEGLPDVGSITLGGDASIGVLSDDVLLIIFGFHRVSSPLHWHRLTHVCQRWRRIVFASPRSLNIQLYCTPKMPVRNTLDCWPTLPIVVRCKMSSHSGCMYFSPEDEDNIIAALQHHNRVRGIELCLTESLMEKWNTQVKGPFSELEDLVLRPTTTGHLSLSPPITTWWGSRLRVLGLTSASFPSLPLILSSSPNLVDLRLNHTLPTFEFPSLWAFANALSGMNRLESLSVEIRSRSSSSIAVDTRTGIPLPSGRRVVLPALTLLAFRGMSEYLERLVALIDAPCLRGVEFAFFDPDRSGDPIQLPQLGQFISRIETRRPHRAEISATEICVYFRFTLSALKSPSLLILRTYRRRLDKQLSSMAPICNQFSPFLGTGTLGIVANSPKGPQDAADGEQWLRLLRSFSGAERFYLIGDLAADIIHALQQSKGEPATILPALRKLCVVMKPELPCGPLRAAVALFTTSRQLSGRPIMVESLSDGEALFRAYLEDDDRH